MFCIYHYCNSDTYNVIFKSFKFDITFQIIRRFMKYKIEHRIIFNQIKHMYCIQESSPKKRNIYSLFKNELE